MKSQYRSSKSVAKNKTVAIAADDPRVAPGKIAQTRARMGAEIEIVGLDGKSLVTGGSNTNNYLNNSNSLNSKGKKTNIVIPGLNGNEPYEIGYGAIVPGDISNIALSWSGLNLVVTFDWGYDDDANKSVSEFILEITAEGVTGTTPFGSFIPNRTQTSQTITLTKELNAAAIGVLSVDITSVCIFAIDPFYNKSAKFCAAQVPLYVSDLPIPVITVTAISNGYSVAYTTPTQGTYDSIDIFEYESNSSTEPTGVVYSRSFIGALNPANIIVPTLNARWVKARFASITRKPTDFSLAQKVIPSSSISVDNTPPNEVTAVTGVWSGDNLIISYTLPNTDPASRVKIQLTAPNNLVGFFYRFPAGALTNQTTIITKQDLFDQFGEHYSSFSGVLRSVDSVDNISAGVSFLIATRANPLAGITPTFTTVPLSNAYSVNYTLPLGAVYAEVYAKHTEWVGDPTDDTYVVYSGLSPAVIVDTDYTPVYIKIRYYDDFNNNSNYSAQGTVTPLNPGEITSFENPISFGENAVIFAGGSPTSGTRTLFKTGGIFAFDETNSAPSTQIVSNASAGTPTFITTQAQIADWKISASKIENDLSGPPTKYTGLSASGTYSFWAGSDVSGGNSSADFTVTPTGVVTARNISIIGNGNPASNLISAGGLFSVKNNGALTATSADIQGKITADSGEFTGNVLINGGSLYSPKTSGIPSSSNAGVIFNPAGVAAYNGAGGSAQMLTTALADGSVFFTTAANIGGWKVDASIIEKRSGDAVIELNSTQGYIAVYNDNIGVSGKAGINSPKNATDVVFWAGPSSTLNATTNPFRVTLAGKLFATDADITGTIKADNGQIGSGEDYWIIDSNGITAEKAGRIKIGNYSMKSLGTTDFQIYDDANNQSLLRTDTADGFGRIFLGQIGRQVELAKNAEISGGYSNSSQDYRSGGLRNMFTITQAQYNSEVFPSALKGSVLLVYDPTSTG